MRTPTKIRWDEQSVEFWELMGFLHGDGSVNKQAVMFYAGGDEEKIWLQDKIYKVKRVEKDYSELRRD